MWVVVGAFLKMCDGLVWHWSAVPNEFSYTWPSLFIFYFIFICLQYCSVFSAFYFAIFFNISVSHFRCEANILTGYEGIGFRSGNCIDFEWNVPREDVCGVVGLFLKICHRCVG